MALHGTSKRYIVDRLKREGETALLAAVEAGKITALTAAVELGWVQRPPVVGKYPQRAKRRDFQLRAIADDGHVTSAQWQELWLGPQPGGKSVFSSRQELVAAWERARERMMASLGPGRRPCAYYEFEYPGGRRPAYAEERSTLWRANLLSDAERTTLEAEWKTEFETAQAPDFTLSDGSGELLRGDCARIAHYRWADIPDKLVKRWSAARRRREQRSAAPLAAVEEAAAIK